MWNEDYDRLSSLMSFAATYVDDIPTVKEFVDNIINGADEIISGWEFLKR